MTALKPLLSSWLYANWSRIAHDPAMVVRGWDSCGLRCMFDDRHEETVRNANHAMWDESHELYPLFPNCDHTEPSETAITTEAMEHVCTEDDEHSCDEQLRALTSKDAVTVDAVRHVCRTMP